MTRGVGTLGVEERGGRVVVVVRLEVDPRYRAIAEERVAGTIEALIDAAGGVGTVTLLRVAHHAEYHVALDQGSALRSR